MGVAKMKLERCGFDRGSKRLREAGLSPSSYFTSNRFAIEDPSRWPAQRDALLADIELAGRLQAGKLILLTGSAGALTYQDAERRFVEQVRDLLPAAAAANVRLALEMHLTVAVDVSFVNQLHDALDLADSIDSPWFGVNFEVTHTMGERWLYQDIGARIGRFVNVQSGDYKMGTRTTGHRVPFGDGYLPLARIFDALNQAGYESYLELETHGPQVEALGYEESLRRSLAWWANYQVAGL